MDLNMRVLKAKIRGLECEGRSIRKKIEQSTGPDRDGWWNLKRKLGWWTRVHLIAYALLRGKPYAAVERKANSVSLENAVLDVILENTYPWQHREWTLQKVHELLQRPKVETHPTPEKDVSGSKEKDVSVQLAANG